MSQGQEKKFGSPFKGPKNDYDASNQRSIGNDSAISSANRSQSPMLGAAPGGPKPISGLSMSKGLRSIHTKIHNNRVGISSNKKHAGDFLSNEDFLELNTPRDENGGMPSPRQNGQAATSQERSAKLNGALQLHRMRTLKDSNVFRFGAGQAFESGTTKGPLNSFGRIGAHLVSQMESQASTRLYPHVKAGEFVPSALKYADNVSELEYPETGLNSIDYNKRLRFEQLKSTRIESLCKWKQNDVKGIKKNAYIKEIQKKNESILTVTDKSALEKLEVYTDRFPLLHFRKQVRKLMIFIHLFSKFVIETKIFDNITIFVILANSIVMMFEGSQLNPPPFFVIAEEVFLQLYTIEATLKIVGKGFIMGEDAYLRDAWNILDFSIVLVSYTMKLSPQSPDTAPEEATGFSPASLRVFRVLRPLKAISSIKGLKVLMVALFSAMPLLRDTLLILLFFFIIFAIGGCQLVGGELKMRCYNIQTGKLHPDEEMLCGIFRCPGGYYCGKSNKNPNWGTTNFDNLYYSMLAVFQCVTMEGWSDIQYMMQKAYSYYMFMFFVPLVFIGAFFLLNLTLAVINSKFTEAHKEQQMADKEAIREAGQMNFVDNVDADVMKGKDEMSIAQFITARIYAKKMIEFLRMRQEIKRITKEKMDKQLAKQKKNQEAKRNITTIKTSDSMGSIHGKNSHAKAIQGRNGNAGKDQFASSLGKSNQGNISQAVIKEEENEHIEEASDGGKLDKDIKNFLKDQKARQGKGAKDIKVPSKINTANLGQKNDMHNKLQSIPNSGGINGGPTMKGNIGPSMKKNVNVDDATANQKKIFSKMAEEFDIDNVIPKNEQKNSVPKDFEPNSSMQSFDLSIKNYEIESNYNSSEGGRKVGTVAGSKGFSQTPDLFAADEQGEGSGLITSDSDFDQAEAAAGYKVSLPQQQQTPTTENPMLLAISNHLKKDVARQLDLRKDVTRTFKKMLTSNHNRQNNLNNSNSNINVDEASTKYGGSQARQDFDNQTQLSEIETKFKRKKESAMRRFKNKVFKDEEDVDETYLEDKYTGGGGANIDFQKTKKEDIRQLEEFISTKRPKDPFKELDPLIEKVDINPEAKYQGTSQNEVFQQRIKDHEKFNPLEQNQFLQIEKQQYDGQDPDFEDLGFVRTAFKPYQQKVFYEIEPDSSPLEEQNSSENENLLFQKEQPYATPTSVNYNALLKQIAVKEIAKRSDVMITSTLSLSMFPKDKRMISFRCKRALMDREELTEYVDEKAAFYAMVKENAYQSKQVRDKDKDFRDNYLKSFIHKSDFCSRTLKKFKFHTQQLNSNAREAPIVDRAVVKAEKQKHEQNKRASEKRGLPKFDMDMARKLLEGTFHEEDEDDDDGPAKMEEIKFVSKQEIDHQLRLEQFENQVKQAVEADDEDAKPHADEIPKEIRKSFKLPRQMGQYTINFHQIRVHDISSKKQKPLWSGQDVLPLQLDEAKSEWVITHLNENRIWPPGLHGVYKRARFVMRVKVKSGFFDSLMTFAVLCNTVTLAMGHHGIEPSLEGLLDDSNVVFTWLFIYEMLSKLIAIGVGKYCGDKMNYIDGSVVLLSVFEMVAQLFMQGGGGLSQFKALRMLRTFRVFRIARLLRALESMQTIIQVMVKSYKSFIYITILMFLFIYIFALLGVELFGNKFNYEEGVPRANYDIFGTAFITVFQVMTMENWQTVLYSSMRGNNPKALVAIFYIAWIFMGNFILLNLFLAILLDSFLSEDEEGDEDDDMERRKKKLQKMRKRKSQLDQHRVFMSYQFYQDKKQTNRTRFYFGEDKGESEEDLEDLDEDQIVKIFKQQGIIKKDVEEIKLQPLFVGVDCSQALFLFSKDNIFRIACYKMYKHAYWEKIVMLLIILSSLKLATDTYSDSWEGNALVETIMDDILDNTFTILFLLEMVVKLIALGCVMDDGSYLRDNWNRLDFFIVNTSIIELSFKDFDLPIIKIFRMLRTLRPLRFISHNVAMRLIVGALIESVGSILNVLSVVAVMFLIFAIVGVSFFGGGFWFCSIDPYKLHNEKQCMKAGGEWMNQDHNFDSVGIGMITLFVVSSLEGWPDIMFQALDFTGQDKGPTYGNSPEFMIYFVAFILIGSFFLLNFFIGVLFLEYNKAQKEEQKGYSDSDLHWQDIQRLIIQAEPEYETTNVPKSVLRKQIHTLVSSGKFESFIMCIIMLNMIQMACLHEGQPSSFADFLDVTNYIFSVIFLIEATLKLIAYADTYFNNSWNKFDFFVVVASIFDVLMDIVGSKAMEGLSSAPQIARVLRVLRVARIVRLAGKAKNLQAIIQTIQFSVPSLMNVFLLLVLIFFMFAILGNFAFGTVIEGEVINDNKNYVNAMNGFLFLFALSTGEDWNKVMFDCSRRSELNGGNGCTEGLNCGTNWSFVFHTMLIVICTYVMLNLFILVIIQQFEKYYLPQDNMISKFKTDQSRFMEVWKEFTQDKYNCKKIKENQLTKFFRKLGEKGDKKESLGFGEHDYEDGELKKQLLKMAIKSDNGYIYFNELLYRCMRRKYGNMKINKKMQIFELKTQYRIYLITLSIQNQNKKLSNEDIFNSIIKKENGVNPFLTVMNFKISFRTWMKFARKAMKQKELANNNKKEQSYETDEQLKMIPVDIEVEEIYSCTSEEEVPEASIYSLGRRKSIAVGGLGQLSPTGSVGDLGVSSVGGSTKKKQKDHLKLFEKKMAQKLKWQQILSGSKNGKDGKSMMGSINSGPNSSSKAGQPGWRNTQFGMALQKTKTQVPHKGDSSSLMKSQTKKFGSGGGGSQTKL